MKDEGQEKLTEIFVTATANIITIGRYINQVPGLINDEISKREVEIAKKKFETKKEDYQIVKFFKDIWNSILSIGSNTDKIHLPNYFNSSSLLLIFAMLEDTSRELGKVAKKLAGTSLSINDIYEQNDVKKVKIYLEKHIGIDFSEVEELWFKIDNYTQVRNCIIHRNSKINDNGSKSTKKLIEHLEKENRIEFEKEKFSINDPEYVKEFLNTSQSFIYHIIFKLTEKFNLNKE